ncbi:SIGNAL RECOGNITION PARTICLE 68 KDA PROTEIN, putative [Babesia bigemina]|uniref:Signal recognition particle subunit SRP68 n=1 Tax=Babesia bigemina TaxID=5866 RepID=A0A061DBS5_BABBI|nr:SIGNAL RECOGNITION PARTICLE 68 KDA PROTEIN, putative [Babesia bigemina]CDR97417.1 SIGNAL RECOGNITION PARTICLE 68 KDA PROTEIN, putative [Babesia bigemina]|eukprot:XP_012769603.1 SIGNAL RECOGNITION PARTICLE 68 KDA PROTEIN, putative [Babesia bigemina]
MATADASETYDVDMDTAEQPGVAEGGEHAPEREKLDFAVLDYVNNTRFKHGIRSDEYGRYHAYCSKRLRILRRQGRTAPIKPNKYVKDEIDEENVDARSLEILTLTAERCWSHAMELKSRCESSQSAGPTERHHYVKRFERAFKTASRLEALCHKFGDTNSINNARVYRNFMEGNVHFEHGRFAEAYASLSSYANVMEQRKRSHQDDRVLQEAYASQLSNVNAAIKLCSFHMRAAGVTAAAKQPAREDDPNAELIAIVPDDSGNLAVYCRGSHVNVTSQFLLQQLLDAINATQKLVVTEDVLTRLVNAADVDAALKGELFDAFGTDALLSSYEEIMMPISEVIDAIHSEMMSSIDNQEPLRQVEGVVAYVKTLLEMEKCALVQVMTLHTMFHEHGKVDKNSGLPDCGEALRFTHMLKQHIATLMGDSKMGQIFLMPQEVTKTVNGLLLGMHKLATGEHNDGMALMNWANNRLQQQIEHPKKQQTLLIWRTLVCFQLLHNTARLCAARFYKRTVAIYARHTLQLADKEDDGEAPLDFAAVFGLEKRPLPAKPILLDLAYIHYQPPQMGKKTSFIGNVKSMFNSFWQ